MCKNCLDMATEIFPECSEDERGYILMNLTAFPFNHGEDLRKQLMEVRKQKDEGAGNDTD